MDMALVHCMVYLFHPNLRRHSLCLPMEDGQAELTWVADYIQRWFTHSPIQVLTCSCMD